jgi:hypothetical protein
MKRIYSYGGCGCTALRVALGLQNHAPDKHQRNPPIRLRNAKIGYIYGDPRNSIISFYRRWQKKNIQHLHGENLGVYFRPGITFEQYLARGVDIFQLENHFHNWTNWTPKGSKLILIKFEDLFANLDQISEFFGQEIRIEPKDRQSNWKDLPKPQKERLTQIFTSLLDKIKQQKPIIIRG